MVNLIIQDSEGNALYVIPIGSGLRITTQTAQRAPFNTSINIRADEQGRLILEGGSALIASIKGEGMAGKVKK